MSLDEYHVRNTPMVSRTAMLLVLALGGACLCTHVKAQEADSEQSGPLPSLRERLEQFRQDLIGDPPPPRSNPYNSAAQKSRASSQQRQSTGAQANRAAPAVSDRPILIRGVVMRSSLMASERQMRVQVRFALIQALT